MSRHDDGTGWVGMRAPQDGRESASRDGVARGRRARAPRRAGARRGARCGTGNGAWIAVALVALLVGCAGVGPAAVDVASVRVDHVVRGEGAVACVDRHAAAVGAAVLARGGNAVDAAVATAFALAVTWPPAGNVGGGGMMVVAMADGTRVVVDARETAPAAFTRDAFLDGSGAYDASRAADPWLCVGVPGSVRGLGEAHARFGVLPWAQLVEPAVRLARDGFERDDLFVRFGEAAAPGLARVPASREVFLTADGSVPPAGTRLVQPALAETLATIAREGPDALHEGPLAEALAADVRAGGGLLTAEDLAAYRAVVREPLVFEVAGHTLLAAPPPSSGGVALAQILGQLERLGALDDDPATVPALHLYAEAARRAFAERARWLGDPAFTDVPVARLLAPSTLDALAASVDGAAATSSASLGPPLTADEPRDTTHLSVVDADGNAVAFTTTLEASYGSKAVSASTGVLLNNQLRDFNRIPGTTNAAGHIGTPANEAAPGKRPLTSMTPVVVLRDGEVVLVTGSPGGRTIINTVAQVLLAVVGRGADVETAVLAARTHHAWFPDELVFEAGRLDPAVRAALEALGHHVVERADEEPLRGTQGAAHSVARDPATGVVTGVGDPRRDGWAGTPGR